MTELCNDRESLVASLEHAWHQKNLVGGEPVLTAATLGAKERPTAGLLNLRCRKRASSPDITDSP